MSGRNRAYPAFDETIAYSSLSDDSSSTDSSRPPRPRRPTFLEMEYGRVSTIYTSRAGPVMPANGDVRGGGFAPAHRRNLVPALNNNQTLSKVIAAARQRKASGSNTAGSRPTVPIQEEESWGGSAPAPSNIFDLALGNNYYERTPYGSTPVNYEPLSPWEGD